MKVGDKVYYTGLQEQGSPKRNVAYTISIIKNNLIEIELFPGWWIDLKSNFKLVYIAEFENKLSSILDSE